MEQERAAIRSRFAGLFVDGDTTHLGEGALLIAAHARPGDVDIDARLDEFDAIAEQVQPPTLDGLRRTMFQDLGFSGNRGDYYDPENSYLDLVLDRRAGIPITLSIVTLEVARRAKVPIYGAGMPGHFLVGDRLDSDVFVDPFNGGTLLDIDGARRLYESFQPSQPFEPGLLAETPYRAILLRVLNNLYQVHQQAKRPRDVLAVLELLVLVPGAPPDLRRPLADLLARYGRLGEAADHLELLAQGLPEEQAVRLRSAATRHRARLN